MPQVIEALEIWSDGVSLNIDYVNQIAWGGLKFEVLRRNPEGKLIHSDGFMNMPFSIRQEIPIKAVSYQDYIIQLLSKSLTYSVSTPIFSTNCKLVTLTIGYEKETFYRRTNPSHTQGV
jgi:hypothetical protein